MLDQWLRDALTHSNLSQAELARQLSDALNRSITRGTISKILGCLRQMNADEMIEIARICRYPLPSSVLGINALEIEGDHTDFVLRCRGAYLYNSIYDAVIGIEKNYGPKEKIKRIEDYATLLAKVIVNDVANDGAKTPKSQERLNFEVTTQTLEALLKLYSSMFAKVDEVLLEQVDIISNLAEAQVEKSAGPLGSDEREQFQALMKARRNQPALQSALHEFYKSVLGDMRVNSFNRKILK